MLHQIRKHLNVKKHFPTVTFIDSLSFYVKACFHFTLIVSGSLDKKSYAVIPGWDNNNNKNGHSWGKLTTWQNLQIHNTKSKNYITKPLDS